MEPDKDTQGESPVVTETTIKKYVPGTSLHPHIPLHPRPVSTRKSKPQFTPTREQMAEIETDILQMLTNGFSQNEIIREIMDNFEGLTKPKALKYFNDTKIVNDKEKDIEFQKALALRRLETFLADAIAKKDIKLAKEIQRDITDLLGLAAEKKSTINHTLKPLNQMTDKELAILIEENPQKLLN